jgi:hypothetical protein
MKVNVHVQRLIIEGASQAEAVRIAEELRGSLSQWPHGLEVRPAAMARLDAGVLPRRSNAGQIGRHIAGEIFASMKGPRHA